MDPDMEHSPVDLINGVDFIISKSSKGGYSDYSTSKWARKESSITEEMQDAIAQYGLPDLSTYLPKKPTPEQLSAMYEMFQASVDGELYDPERWQQFYRPNGFAGTNTRRDEDAAAAAPSSPVRPVTRPAVQPPAPRPAVPQLDTDDMPYDDAPTAPPVSQPVAQPAADGAKKSPQEILAMLRNRNK